MAEPHEPSVAEVLILAGMQDALQVPFVAV
jgi:hypothetical protein